jgi:hypothetical protein
MMCIYRYSLTLVIVAGLTGFLVPNPVFGQTVKSKCGCTRGGSAINATPMSAALFAFLNAITKSEREGIVKYSAPFTLNRDHRRVYRSHAEQQLLIDELTKLGISDFYVCGYFTSTAEFRYRESLRRYEMSVCLTRGDGGETKSGIYAISCYHQRDGWLIDASLLLQHLRKLSPNKSLDASGGSVFCNLIRPAMLE